MLPVVTSEQVMPQPVCGQATHLDASICGNFPALLAASPAAIHAHDSTQANARENTMTLNEMYGSEADRFPLQQEAAEWNDAIPELEWDETEAQSIASELIGRRHEEY
jgi:hypothetical protein